MLNPVPRDAVLAPCDGSGVQSSLLLDELRTIATCMLGFTELLRDSAPRPKDRQLYLSVLHEQAMRLARLVVERHDDMCERSVG